MSALRLSLTHTGLMYRKSAKLYRKVGLLGGHYRATAKFEKLSAKKIKICNSRDMTFCTLFDIFSNIEKIVYLKGAKAPLANFLVFVGVTIDV